VGEGSRDVFCEPRAFWQPPPPIPVLEPPSWRTTLRGNVEAVHRRHNHQVDGARYRGDLLAAGPRRTPQFLPLLLVSVPSPFILLHARCSTECLLYIFNLN
jgi:hypothetical protein